MKSAYHCMFAVLVGEKGAYALFHERQAWSLLAQEIQEQIEPGRPSISIEAQDAACAFLRAHGTRAARRYANALWRGRMKNR